MIDMVIFDEFKRGKECDCYASYGRLFKGMLKKVSFVMCGRLLFIAIFSAGFPSDRHRHYLQESGQSQDIQCFLCVNEVIVLSSKLVLDNHFPIEGKGFVRSEGDRLK